jgi:hypothetical protein
LSEVQILASLQPQERAKIADVLESRTYTEGQDVIKEGDAGEEFYLIESGTAVAVKKDANGGETVVKQYVKGDYFGGEYCSDLLFNLIPFPGILLHACPTPEYLHTIHSALRQYSPASLACNAY